MVCSTAVCISNMRHYKESENKVQIVLRFLVSPIFYVYGGGLCHCQRNSKHSEKNISFLKVRQALLHQLVWSTPRHGQKTNSELLDIFWIFICISSSSMIEVMTIPFNFCITCMRSGHALYIRCIKLVIKILIYIVNYLLTLMACLRIHAH